MDPKHFLRLKNVFLVKCRFSWKIVPINYYLNNQNWSFAPLICVFCPAVKVGTQQNNLIFVAFLKVFTSVSLPRTSLCCWTCSAVRTRWSQTTLTTRSAGSTAWLPQVRVTSRCFLCALRPSCPSTLPLRVSAAQRNGSTGRACCHPTPQSRPTSGRTCTWDLCRMTTSLSSAEVRVSSSAPLSVHSNGVGHLDDRECLEPYRLYWGVAKQDLHQCFTSPKRYEANHLKGEPRFVL